ncbi:hypothetical protein Dimus_006217 [Dionaea muscipula]
MNNPKKRKGCGSDGHCESRLTKAKTEVTSIIRSHVSLEDCVRVRKNVCKDVGNGDDGVGCSSRNLGAATVPPRVRVLAPEVEQSRSRGLKRKIGCIDVATQMGRKNKLEDNYDMIKIIGKGKFGSVWLCKHKGSGKEFACKTLQKGEETVHREVEIMQHLSGHPGIVILNAVYEDSEYYHLVMELCSGGRLIDQIKKEGRFSERQAARLIKDLMMVIKYCHEMGVVHRDIKPENILLTSSGKMKLADFGLAVRISEGQCLNGLAGSPSYIAPEVISGPYGEKVDVWSAGVLLHALLTGSLPFHGSSIDSIFDAVKNVKLDFHSEMWQSISKPAQNLMERMMTRDVSARITAQEILGHPWIMFYTEHTFRSFSVKSKVKPRLVATPEQGIGNAQLRVNSNFNKASLGRNTSASNFISRPCPEGHENCDLLDALTAAISQVSISEPKRTRLAVMTPIQHQYSANSLCEAF